MRFNFIRILLQKHFFYYPTPISLNFFWNFGFVSGICLVIQLISGIFLASHYCSDADLAFNSVEYIMRRVNNGWLLRYVHSNGASFFLLAVYIHIARGVYYKSYMGGKSKIWYTGVAIFLCLMATAFLGYVLPWGQMSFWGATVITNLVSALPIIGQPITEWLWGGPAVNNSTLSRFFVLHFILPFVLTGLVLLHIGLVHEIGSSSSTLFDLENIDVIPFYPYYILKDFFVLLCFLFVFSYFVFFEPNMLGHSDNYIRANPIKTPAHIVPEWYFLSFYAILRCIPNKLGGIAFMFGSIFILFFLPILTEVNEERRNSTLFSEDAVFFDVFFVTWLLSFVCLGWLGAMPVERPYTILAPHVAAYYIFYFFLYFKSPFSLILNR
jgi:quinol-cytochrome oxidoreductase complex cytochrome b subunit